jgi:hypothetical protein
VNLGSAAANTHIRKRDPGQGAVLSSFGFDWTLAPIVCPAQIIKKKKKEKQI